MRNTNWIEIVGIVAVVISLLLLTFELNQANSLARATIHSDVSQQFNDVNLQLASDTAVAELWMLLADPDYELTDVEIQRAIGLAWWHRNAWNNAELMFREGWLSARKFQSQLADIESTTKMYPGLKPYLRLAVKTLNIKES